MTDYYSQHGEDFILDQMFAGKATGFFVEVGCIDGMRFSNTLHFERKGWKGMCIEAHPDYIPLLKANRPHSIVCHCAVGATDQDDVIFYANKRGSLSTLDKFQEARWKKDYAPYFHGFEEKHVPMKCLDTIFQENAITHIDILSIDIEGYEVNALNGLNFSVIKPQVLVIESDDDAHERELDSILIPKGYIKSVRISGNIFFVLDPVFDRRVQGKTFTGVQITHTQHPLDNEGDQVKIFTISTETQPEMQQNKPERKNIFKKLIQKIGRTGSPVSGENYNTDETDSHPARFKFFNVGFHGDKYLLDIVDSLVQNVDTFVETGANVGSTLVYFAQKYPQIPCFSCEPDVEAFRRAQHNIVGLPNIALFNQTSQEFLFTIEEQHPEIFQKRVLFWLDAHGYGFKWPLKDELAFITEKFRQAFILIDDFKVPGKDMFGYDEYEGQTCSYDYIKDSLSKLRSYNIYYPNYTEHTSQHHSLRGWGLIVFGENQGFQIPPIHSSANN